MDAKKAGWVPLGGPEDDEWVSFWYIENEDGPHHYSAPPLQLQPPTLPGLMGRIWRGLRRLFRRD